MEISDRLLVSDSLRKKEKKIRKTIESGKLHKNLYLLCILENNHSQLEIIPSLLFMQTGIKEQKGWIIGAFRDQEEVFDLLQEVSQKVYVEGVAQDLRSYFVNHL